jgi:hypothetical protein
MITREVISHSSPEFREFLKMGCLYLAASDGQFTGEEQDWIDKYFGLNASERFIEECTHLDWDHFFEKISAIRSSLSKEELNVLEQGLRIWLLELLSVDGIAIDELEHLDYFMAFFEKEKTGVASTGGNIQNISTQIAPACPECGAAIEPEQIICTACGFDSRTGQIVKTQNDDGAPNPPLYTSGSAEHSPNWEEESTENNNETGKSVNLWEFLLCHRKRILWGLLITTVVGIYFYDHLTAKTAEEIKVDIVGVWNPGLKNPVGGTFLFYEGGRAEWRLGGEVYNYQWTVESGRDGEIHLASSGNELFFRLRNSKLLELVGMQENFQTGNSAFGGGATKFSGQRKKSKGRYIYRKE